MAIWDDILSDEDRARYEYYLEQNPRILGNRPVLVVVDVTKGFVAPGPTLEPSPIITRTSISGWASGSARTVRRINTRPALRRWAGS